MVIPRFVAANDQRLVAYIIGASGERLSASELRAHLKRFLPSYMIPAAFVPIDALPLMPNGKLDRAALPAPDSARSDQVYVAPRTPLQVLIAGVWQEVLGIEQVGLHDSFFDLGGYSLVATRVVARIRGLFQIELPLRALFQTPTLLAFSDEVLSQQATSPQMQRILEKLNARADEGSSEPVGVTEGSQHE